MGPNDFNEAFRELNISFQVSGISFIDINDSDIVLNIPEKLPIFHPFM